MAATPSAKNYIGFRFDPTDEELVVYYLKRKIRGKKLPKGVIPELDIYKFEPWELAGQSTIETEDNRLYFFCKSQLTHSADRATRCTNSGFWKDTTKFDLVRYCSRIVGVRRALIFYTGSASQAQRTDWVMDEYQLSKEELSQLSDVKGDYVICKVYQEPTSEEPQDHRSAPSTTEDNTDFKESNNSQEKQDPRLHDNPKVAVLSTDSVNCKNNLRGKSISPRYEPLPFDLESTDGLEREMHRLSLDHVLPDIPTPFGAAKQHVSGAGLVHGMATDRENVEERRNNPGQAAIVDRTENKKF